MDPDLLKPRPRNCIFSHFPSSVMLSTCTNYYTIVFRIPWIEFGMQYDYPKDIHSKKVILSLTETKPEVTIKLLEYFVEEKIIKINGKDPIQL